MRGERFPEFIQEEIPGVVNRSCLRERSSNCRSPRVRCPGEGTFPRTITHVCGAREVEWFESQYEFSHPTRLTLLAAASRSRTGRSASSRSRTGRSASSRSGATRSAAFVAAALLAAAQLGQVALRQADLRAMELGHLPAALVATAVAAGRSASSRSGTSRRTSSRCSTVRSASRRSGTRWRTGRGSSAGRSMARGRGRAARSTRLRTRSRAAGRGRATVMVEQPSGRRASDAKQHGERQNPLHSGISSRNVSDSRELFLPYGPLTRRSNAVESSLGLGGH